MTRIDSRLILWVEGRTDASVPERDSPQPAQRARAAGGALLPIIRNVLRAELSDTVPAARLEPALGDDRFATEWLGAKLRNAHHRPGFARGESGLSGRARKLMIALMNERARDPDALLIAIWDRDASPEQLEDRDSILRALRSNPTGMAVGVCVEAVEAWLLADPAAYKRCFGRGPAAPPRAPESIVRPKRALDDVLEELGCDLHDDRPALYRRIAEEVDIRVLMDACPVGFAKLVEALRAGIAPTLRARLTQ